MARFVSEKTWLTHQIKRGRYVASIMVWKDWAVILGGLAIFGLAGWKVIDLILLAIRAKSP